jgi:hypothetical protein
MKSTNKKNTYNILVWVNVHFKAIIFALLEDSHYIIEEFFIVLPAAQHLQNKELVEIPLQLTVLRAPGPPRPQETSAC